ncbi:hypothetical protein CPLU01_06124 [Colletotrichum plurivorum]|uniref:ABC transporter n=1 Tax=Colletotrichum plurivorum TaxID=2175906 RepID=A0A8H6NHB2_9PEZI|nr:hypothetical protein CPLU01_06124 [Colletotrichum plurivorum]
MAVLRILSLRSVQPYVSGNVFRPIKLVLICILTAIPVALTALWAREESLSVDSRVEIAVGALTIVDGLAAATLSFTEHSKSVGHSLLLSAFLILSTIFDAVRLRTLWLKSVGVPIVSLSTASLALKLGILVLEEQSKRRWIIGDKDAWSSEETAGLSNRIGFYWLNVLFLKGYSSALSIAKLPIIDSQLLSESLWERIGHSWNTAKTRGTLASYGLIGAYGLVYLCIAAVTAGFQHLVYRYVTMMRGCLVLLIYQKTTSISVVAAEDAAAVTLMSTDIERIVNGMSKIHESWSTLLQMAVALALLYRQLGVVFIAPLGLFLLCAFGAGYLSGSAGTFQASWMTAIQKRVAVTSSVLGSTKGVKLSGLSDKMFQFIQGLRLKEIASASRFRTMLLFIVTLSHAPGSISPVVTFGAYTAIAQRDHTALDSNRIFASLALLNLITQPLNELFAHMPNIMAEIACFGRVQAFLLSPDTSANAGAGQSEGSQSGCSTHPDTEKQPSLPVTPVMDDLVTTKHAIEIRQAKFGWKADAEATLSDVSLNIPRGKLTMIIGPVASGKSTLLKAILGETPTLRRNVTGFSHFEASWYTTVIRACALEDDIATFPKENQVIIGSKVVALSGGQKQRVAIARAVYSRRDIAIFDDVFSGLDFETHNRVFNNIFGTSVHILPKADYVIALEGTGKIACHGTFDELNKQSGYVNKFGLVAKEDEINQEATGDDGKAGFEPAKKNKASESSVDEDTQRLGDRSVYKYYFQATGYRSVAVFVILQIIWVFLTKFPEIWLSWWGEANNRHPNQDTGKYMGVYTALQVCSLIALAITCWHTVLGMAVTSGIKLHWILLERALGAPMYFISTTDTGSIVNRFSQDIQLIDAELPISLLNVAANGLMCIAQALMIIPASYQLIAAFHFLFGVLWLIQRFYLRTSRQLRFLDLDAKTPMYSQLLETLSGLSTIRAFARQKDLTLLMRERLDASQKPMYLLYSIQRWLTLVLDLTVAAPAIVLVLVAVALRGRVGAGFAGVALYNIMGLSSAMKAAVTVWTILETSIGAVARVKTFAEQTPRENKPQESQIPPASWPENGAITFENVTASYSEGLEPVLSGVSFTISPGQKVGICGRSGSCKSSLLLTLLRLIDCSEGRILIDTSTMPRELLRQRLNALPQEPPFFSGSIRDNCDPQGAASDEDIIEALRTVGLWKVIEGKGGLIAEFTDDFFSHGQKQVFCLARGILYPSKTVVMDEATSSVDVDTEKNMIEVVRSRFGNATVISVAHRLDTILDFDMILVLDKGKIIEQGSLLSYLTLCRVYLHPDLPRGI